MGSQIIQVMREKAEMCRGEIECQKKSMELLDEFGIPRGLFPLTTIFEIGLDRSDGFLWLKLKEREDHYFTQIGKMVSFAIEITAVLEPRKLSKLTGVKSKEFFFWVPISDMVVDGSKSGYIQFKIGAGLSRKFPVSAFMEDDEPDTKFS